MKQRVSGSRRGQSAIAGARRRTGADLAGAAGAALLLVLLCATPTLAQDGFRVIAPPPAPAAAPQSAPPSSLAPLGAPVTRAAAPARTSPAATSAAHGDIAGRYAVLRGDKDTGCMLTLEAGVRGPRGANKAVLAPACRDSGLLIFDPVGWEMAQGRLVLMARKGHDTHLERQPDGTWLKDPKEGKPLTLRRI